METCPYGAEDMRKVGKNHMWKLTNPRNLHNGLHTVEMEQNRDNYWTPTVAKDPCVEALSLAGAADHEGSNLISGSMHR